MYGWSPSTGMVGSWPPSTVRAKGPTRACDWGRGQAWHVTPWTTRRAPYARCASSHCRRAWQSPGLSQWRRASLCDRARRGLPSRRGNSTCQCVSFFFHPSPATSKAVYHPTACNPQPHTSSQRPHDRHKWREKPTTRTAAAHHRKRCGDMHQPQKLRGKKGTNNHDSIGWVARSGARRG